MPIYNQLFLFVVFSIIAVTHCGASNSERAEVPVPTSKEVVVKADDIAEASFGSILRSLADKDHVLTDAGLLKIMSLSKTLLPANKLGCTPSGYVNLFVYSTVYSSTASRGQCEECAGPVAMEFSFPAGECVVTPPHPSSVSGSTLLTVTSSTGTELSFTIYEYSDAGCGALKASYPVTLTLSTCYYSNYLFTYTTTSVPAAPGYGMLNQ
jgi:hypothetical protein